MNTAHPSSSDAHHQTPGGSNRLFKRCLAAVLIVAMQVQALAQVTSPIMRNATGAVVSGFSKNGTLMFGGQVLGNPHQLMHDMQNPTLWSTGAVSFSNSTDPTFVQATIDQMMQAIAPPSDPGGLFMSRLYLNPENPYTAGGALSAPPSPTPESGAAAPTGPLIDNFEHYKRALTHAQANVGDRTQDITRWSQTLPEYGDGVSYLAKTHTSSAVRLRNTLFDSAPSRAVFQGAQIPTPGATGFFVVQGAQARTHLANIQEQNAQLLGSRVFFSQQQLDPNSRRFESSLGHQSQNTTLGYIQPNGQAHEFAQDNPILQSGFGLPWARGEWEPAQRSMGEALNHAANQHQVRVQTLQGLDLRHFKDDRALFMQGLDLYKHVSGQERNLLDGLKNGQITAGHPQYAQARALAQGAFAQAYGDHVEFETRLKHSKESAAWQAQNLNLSGISDQALFSQGYNLFDSRASEHQEGLLKRLQAGELKVGSAEYNEARTLAEARFRVDHQQALEPPKKVSSWKKLVSIVVVAVVAFYLGPMATQFAAGALTTAAGGAVVAGSATAMTITAASTVVGSVVTGMASAAIGTAIQTGSVSRGIQAAGDSAENSLKGGVANAAVTAAMSYAGVDASAVQTSLEVSAQTATAITNTISTSLSNTLIGGSFKEHLTQAAINSAVDMVASNVAGDIGKNTDVGSFEKYLAHAALGCGVGAVKSDSSDGCAPGAAGAVVAHYGAGLLDGTTGYTLSDSEVSFYSSLAGGTAAALAGDKNALEGNFGLGQSAGQNAVENNYLKYDEAKKLQALKDQELKGQCTDDCKAEIRRLETVDKQRNEELARCEGSSSAACQKAFKDVRLAAADYVRKDENWAMSGQTVLFERQETLKLAQGTTDGKLQGAVQGYWEALKETAGIVKEGAHTLYAAAKGDEAAWQAIEKGAGAAADYLKEPSNWPYLLGAMTPEQREQLALAYESGNGSEIGRLMAQQMANMPIGGGPMGSIKKIDDVVEAAGKGLPYDPKGQRGDLEVAHGSDNVTSTTVANNPTQRVNSDLDKGIEVISNESGKAVKVTYKDPVSGETLKANVPYDSRGLPVFDDVAKYTTKIDESVPYGQQFSRATRDLRDAINSGKVDPKQFTPTQMKAIQQGADKIPDYTWHHNAQSAPNNMQLIPQKVHEPVLHLGQGSLSKGK